VHSEECIERSAGHDSDDEMKQNPAESDAAFLSHRPFIISTDPTD